MNIFTVIIWAPALKYADEICNLIPNIISKEELIIKDDNLLNFINMVYELDERCTKSYLPDKVEHMKNCGEKHILITFNIPVVKNKVLCKKAIRLKNQIRKIYSNKIPNYIRDIIIHIADNIEQSQHILFHHKKYVIN